MTLASSLHDDPALFKLDRISVLLLIVAGLGAFIILGVRLHEGTTVSQLAYNEGWNAYHALRFQQTGSPYPTADGLVMNNYTPLWFPLVAWAGFATSSLIFAGRLVAMLGLLAVFVSAGVIGGTLRGRTGAFVGFVTMCLAMAAEAEWYIGTADPQFVAQGIGGIALVLAVRADSPRTSMYAWAMVLAVLAGFVKYNLAALPCALLLAAFLDSRSAFLRVTAIAMIALCAGYLLCALIGGWSWPVHLLSARAYSKSRLFSESVAFLSVNAIGLLLAGAGLRSLPRGHVQQVLVAYLLGAIPLAFFFAGGEGVSINIFFDVIIAMAVGASLVAGARAGVSGTERSTATHIVLPAWGGTALLTTCFLSIALPKLLDASIRLRHPQPFNDSAALFRSDIEYLKSIPGNAVCLDLDLCFLAGKPLVFDPFNANQALLTGTISRAEADSLLHNLDIQVIHSATGRSHAVGVPDTVISQVKTDFYVARSNDNGVFYIRRDRSGKP